MLPKRGSKTGLISAEEVVLIESEVETESSEVTSSLPSPHLLLQRSSSRPQLQLSSSSILQMITSFPSRSILKTIAKFFLKLILKLWKWASTFLIAIFFVSWFYGGIIPYFVSLFALLGLGYHISDHLVYQPEIPVESRVFVPTPNSFDLPYEAVQIPTSDRVKLHGYLIKQQKPNSRNLPTIIYFHGNAGNIGHRLQNVKACYNDGKCNTLLVEYRGYGLSDGVPSENGLYLDAKAAFEFVDSRDDLDSSKIVIFGRSLGGAVAIDLASRCDYRDRIAALIVENTFTSIPNLAIHIFPFRFIRWIPGIFYKNRYESLKKINSVVCPVLFISGAKDDLVPHTMMNELHTKCSSNMKRLKRFPSGGHNDTWCCKDYGRQFSSFLDEALISAAKKELPKFEHYGDNDNIV